MSTKEAKKSLAEKLNKGEDKNSLSSLLNLAKEKGADKIEQPHISKAVENITKITGDFKGEGITRNKVKEGNEVNLKNVVKKGYKIKTISLYDEDIEMLEKVREKLGYSVTLSDCARTGIKIIYKKFFDKD